MNNPFGPQQDSGSYVDLRRVFQSVQSAQINEQIVEALQKALAVQHVVLSHPERKCLFSQIVQWVSEDLTRKIQDGSISI